MRCMTNKGELMNVGEASTSLSPSFPSPPMTSAPLCPHSISILFLGKIPVKRTKSLANGTFVREKTRGRWPGKSAHRKHFARGYTPGRKTRGRTPGKSPRFLPGRTPGMFPHFRLQLSCTSDYD
ncbi:hypothetical protein MTR_0669s0020 [Medicago truncatula]|uniref:Uncharacterized protein n=1 Tax=Medicago truncatula TaxID=3880 RepID=A0A072TEK4_MEDTR|nr:hypothetical protein MTR_0669s0020 [Medicago truncatula]